MNPIALKKTVSDREKDIRRTEKEREKGEEEKIIKFFEWIR